MISNPLPEYSVEELNAVVQNLLEKGLPARFIVNATVSSSQIKKGHQWLTLSDGNSSINAVIWSSTIKKLTYRPRIDDGILIVGKLNFWMARATLCIQVIDVRPTISTVLRKFEIVKSILNREGLIDEKRHRRLPKYPKSIAILTSFPSSAFADIEKTAKERWPLTKLVVIPIPVQGSAENYILNILIKLSKCYYKFDLEAIVLARGGGSREDLIVFDDELICREIAKFPIPVITGIGHEDDLTVCDLVADVRASTPTSSIVALLPHRSEESALLIQRRERLRDYLSLFVALKRNELTDRKRRIKKINIASSLESLKDKLQQRRNLLAAFSLEKILERGFAIVKDSSGRTISRVADSSLQQNLTIHLSDGQLIARVEDLRSKKDLLK